MKRRRLLALPLPLPLLVAGPAPRPARAQARTLHLRRGDSLPEVLARARDGDTVELDPGAHHGQAAVITQHGLRLCAPAGRAVLPADGAHAEGKALLVVRASAVRIEGLEFRGARVPSRVASRKHRPLCGIDPDPHPTGHGVRSDLGAVSHRAGRQETGRRPGREDHRCGARRLRA